MARNRKNGSSAIGFGPVLKALLLCLLIGGAGVGYVWQKEQIDSLSRQIDERGVRLARLADENQNRERQLADLRSVRCVEARIKELNLGLAQPSPTQIWRMVEPPREAPKPPPREPQYTTQIARSPAAARAKELMSP
jgi:uncharacterized protein HemX